MTAQPRASAACSWCGAELPTGLELGPCDRCAAAFRAELVYAAAALADVDAEAEATAILAGLGAQS